MKLKLTHITHYIFLLILLILSISAILGFAHQVNYQRFFIIFMGVGYFIWGLAHHYQEDSLYKEVVIEYALVSSLGTFLALGLVYYL